MHSITSTVLSSEIETFWLSRIRLVFLRLSELNVAKAIIFERYSGRSETGFSDRLRSERLVKDLRYEVSGKSVIWQFEACIFFNEDSSLVRKFNEIVATIWIQQIFITYQKG